jgi:ribosomal protein L16/L10AE
MSQSKESAEKAKPWVEVEKPTEVKVHVSPPAPPTENRGTKRRGSTIGNFNYYAGNVDIIIEMVFQVTASRSKAVAHS